MEGYGTPASTKIRVPIVRDDRGRVQFFPMGAELRRVALSRGFDLTATPGKYHYEYDITARAELKKRTEVYAEYRVWR